jgi:hypothetical protein
VWKWLHYFEMYERHLARFRGREVHLVEGGHLPHQQMTTLEAMLPHIRPGGVYVCEDVQGESNAFHTYVDVLTRPLSNFIGLGPVAPSPLQEHVASVHRYPQAVVIEKPSLPVEPFDAPKRGSEWQPYFV